MSTGAQIGALAGAAISFFAVQYLGEHVIIPMVAGALAVVVCKKTSVGPRLFHWAIAAAFAHAAWFVAGAMLAGSAEPLGDAAILGVGIACVWARPSRMTALVLAVPTVLFLAINVFALASAPTGTLAHKALLVHCLLRIGLLVALWDGVSALGRQAVVAAERLPADEPPP